MYDISISRLKILDTPWTNRNTDDTNYYQSQETYKITDEAEKRTKLQNHKCEQ